MNAPARLDLSFRDSPADLAVEARGPYSLSAVLAAFDRIAEEALRRDVRRVLLSGTPRATAASSSRSSMPRTKRPRGCSAEA